MGIQGLLGALKPITKPVHVRELQGLRVGVDAYVWLHRGVFGCAAELCQGKDTKRYLHACFQRLNLLLNNGVGHVCIVFDGGPLPAKRGTEEERRARREENRRKALQLVAEGRAGDAFPYFTKAVDVTPAMAKEWMTTIQASGLQNVTCVVAPYEADAQLAYLCRTGELDAVFTEDSDLLATGCPRVLFKLEEATGMAQQIMHADIFKAPIPGLGDLRTWDGEAFLVMCILSGCDYLPSVTGLGLRSAYRLVHRHKTATKAIRAMRFEAKHKVPADYEARFLEALNTFRHQRVFDPVARALTHVHPLPPDLAATTNAAAAATAAAATTAAAAAAPAAATPAAAALDYLGPWMGDALAAGIADGTVDPITLAPFPPSLPIAPFAATCAVAAASAGAAAAAAASASQPKISAFLAAARQRQQEGEGEEEEEEEEEEGGGGAISVAPGRNAVYRPGLRKSTLPLPLQQNNRITGYLNNNATPATKSISNSGSSSSSSSSSGGSGLGLPAIFRERKAVSSSSSSSSSSSDAEGNEALSSMLPPPARAGEMSDEAAAGGGGAAAATTTSCLPRLSTWFGGKGMKTQPKEESTVRLPSLLSSSSSSTTTISSSSSASSLPWKRQRTLGGRPSAFALRRFAGPGSGGSSSTAAAEEEDEEEEEEGGEGGGGGRRRPRGRSSDCEEGGGGEYGSDSLQPPTPGTPYGAAAAAAAAAAVVVVEEARAVAAEAARPLSQADLDEAGDDDGDKEVAVGGAASAVAAAVAAAAVAVATSVIKGGSSYSSSTTTISFESFLYQTDDDDADSFLSGMPGGGLATSTTTTTVATKTVTAPAAAVAAGTAASFSHTTPSSRRRRAQDSGKMPAAAVAAAEAAEAAGGGGGGGGKVQNDDGEGKGASLSLDVFKFDGGDEPFVTSMM